jgi:hypothetical protein
LHTRPGLGSYLSEVDRFALDMRKRFTVPTDCRYIDARVAESVTTAPYIEQPTPASSRPRHRAARARSTISTRNTAMMGPWVHGCPSTDISRSRTVPNNVGNTGLSYGTGPPSARGVAVTGISI